MVPFEVEGQASHLSNLTTRWSSEDHPGVIDHLSSLRCITPTGWENCAFERWSEDDRSSTTRLFHQCILFFVFGRKSTLEKRPGVR
ncbi:hypothetical protein PISMIDRAFT_682496 [Pisolithus microcarpus 441]|uniref:Uncharacterized protein n=1 Tax=Pisolithus microcarpus 441 TaxID=765257 RepID=A0A0C9Z1Q7_9AGAM|nr:hypothetical protein PISMIDRAFT_682496 [Pisolithus microcarpus 441]